MKLDPEPALIPEPPADPAISDLHGQELRDRATSGAVLVAIRSFGVLVIGLLGYLVFARVLSPAEFGLAALGLSITFFGHFLADAGIGPALLRRREAPTKEELASVMGWQLAVMTLLVLVAIAWALIFDSRTAAVTAVFLGGLPLLAVRVPATITLERELHYRPLMLVEVFEVLVFNIVAVAAVLLGSGVFGLAGATVVKTLAGTLALNRLAPGLLMLPRLRVAPLRGLLNFGVLFQASSALSLARDFFANVLIVALGGYAMAGLNAIAGRLTSIPSTIFEAISRVSFPAMSRLLGAEEDPREPIERGVAICAVLAVILLAPLAACSSAALASVLGEKWREAGVIIPTICLGLTITMPISVMATGFLYALGDARTVLTSNVALTSVSLGAMVGLLPVLGYPAVGYSALAGSVVDAAILARAIRRHTQARVAGLLVRPVGVGVIGFGAGSAAIPLAAAPPAAAALAAGVSLGIVGCGLALVDRQNLIGAVRMIRSAVGRARHTNTTPRTG